MAREQSKKLSTKTLPCELIPEEMTYAANLRSAVYNGITEDDVVQIVKKITDQAKAGDETSVKLLFDYVLGKSAAPSKVVVNNHFSDVETGARVMKAVQQLEREGV